MTKLVAPSTLVSNYLSQIVFRIKSSIIFSGSNIKKKKWMLEESLMKPEFNKIEAMRTVQTQLLYIYNGMWVGYSAIQREYQWDIDYIIL